MGLFPVIQSMNASKAYYSAMPILNHPKTKQTGGFMETPWKSQQTKYSNPSKREHATIVSVVKYPVSLLYHTLTTAHQTLLSVLNATYEEVSDIRKNKDLEHLHCRTASA